MRRRWIGFRGRASPTRNQRGNKTRIENRGVDAKRRVRRRGNASRIHARATRAGRLAALAAPNLRIDVRIDPRIDLHIDVPSVTTAGRSALALSEPEAAHRRATNPTLRRANATHGALPEPTGTHAVATRRARSARTLAQACGQMSPPPHAARDQPPPSARYSAIAFVSRSCFRRISSCPDSNVLRCASSSSR